MSIRRPIPKNFLEDYSPADTFLAKPNPAQGRPGLLTGQTSDGREVLIKMWSKPSGSGQDELLYIWRSEVRQLQRLAAIPGADELFVQMLASGEDAEGFYLVLDLGEGSPLDLHLRSPHKGSIAAQYRTPRARRVLWMNALRAAQALDLLHAQGVIHRNIDPWAIVTALGDQPDFRLTGFEWSMRIASLPGPNATPLPSKGDALAASFSQDWRNLGFLIGQLVGAPAEKVADLSVPPSDIASHLSSTEGRVLRLMLGVNRIDQLDGQHICREITQVIAAMDAEVAGKEMKSLLALRLGPDSRLGEAVRTASGQDIEMSDTSAQLQFVKDDLSDEPFLARVKGKAATDAEQTVLMGRRLTYVLAPYRKPGTTTPPDWEFALCDRTLPGRPPASALIGTSLIEPASLDLHSITEAHKNFALRRGRVARWDERVATLTPDAGRRSDTERKHQAFALLSLLEMAYAAANIFPVEVLPGSADKRGDLHLLRVKPRHDQRRADLSKALKLEAPALRLVRMLEADDVSGDTGWTLVASGSLGESEKDTEWKFVAMLEEEGQQVIQFEGPEETALDGQVFLAPTGQAGEVVQFKRRVKALRTLAQHSELLKMLVDPRRRIDDTHDPLIEDQAFKDLDASKRDALKEILSTVPLFLLQGPPGVGKTFLVADIVRRRFDDEPTTRLLLSAQSNAAIDHLMKEVQAVFNGPNLPIMVRARPAQDDAADTDLELDKQASRELQKLAQSPLVADADTKLAQKIRDLADAAKSKPVKGKRPLAAETRAFESMILRAANLVFATTNSAAIENLIEERGFFDWTIVEEAGKATGGELLSPLLLSHRRLMIGDHKQLPPFGADRLETILSDPITVRDAVKAAQGLIERYLQDAAIEDMFDEVNAENTEYGRLCADALQILNLFASIVEAELAPRPGKSSRRPIARRLDEQHRMHPAIAKVVSNCFYGGGLHTNKAKVDYYRSGQPTVRSIDGGVLPDKPIIFIDMPWVRDQVGNKCGDRGPAWSNPEEAKAVLQTLAKLRSSTDAKPSLAVLSPYREQVKVLSRTLADAQGVFLAHLKDFSPAVGNGAFCGTVDSFQGDQADLVIVSMVRNNGHAAPAKALGFLRDNRRMNVLLSRAKWRLIIIGSLRFYNSVSETAHSLPDSEIGFLRTFLTELTAAKAAGDAAIVPWSKIAGGAT